MIIKEMDFNIDIAIVGVFLLITLAVGLWHGRGVKTIEDYALGGRNFSTASLVSTIVATVTTGSLFMIGISRTYVYGLYDLIPVCGIAISLLITAYILIPRMSKFIGNVSIAESLGNYYGNKVRIIAAICSIVANIGAIAVQYKVFGGIVNYFLGINIIDAVIISGAVVTLYSAFGGIKAVTFTDVFQFMIFGVMIPIVGMIIWNSIFNIENFSFANSLEQPIFDINAVFDYHRAEFWEMFFLFIYFALPAPMPAVFQRIIMGRNIAQAKTAFIISAIIILFVIIAIAWIAFLIFNIKQGLTPDHLLSYIVDNYTYTGLKGVVIIGIVAMSMSSADSFINVASVLFAHDVCRPLKLGQRNELMIARGFALCLGGLAIILALSNGDLLGILLFANAFYTPIVSTVIFVTILGFRTTSKTILISMSTGFFIVLVWKLLNIKFDVIVPAVFINLLVIFAVHYFSKQPGGWSKSKEMTKTIKKESFANKSKNFNFSTFFKKNSPNDERTYSLFGIFCFIYTISTIYLMHDNAMSKHSVILLYIYQSMLIISCFFMLYMMWSPRLKHPVVVGILWNVSLIYMLSFCSTFFLMLGSFGTVQAIIFTLNLMVLFNLSRWRTALFSIIVGFVCGAELFKYYSGTSDIDIALDQNYLIMYIALLVVSALITFLKPKQDYIEHTEEKLCALESEVFTLGYANLDLGSRVSNLKEKVGHYAEKIDEQQVEIERLGSVAQKILNNVNHELRLPVGNVTNFSEMLLEQLEKYNDKELKELTDEVYQNSIRLSSMILNMLDLATLDVKNVNLDKTLVNLSEIVKTRAQVCHKMYVEDKKVDIKLIIQPEIMLSVDPNYIKQAIDNLVINAIKFSDKGVIKIKLEKPGGIVTFTITDEGRGIPKDEIYDIFGAFKMASNTESRAEGRGVGLTLCKSVIEAHGGIITAKSQRVGAKFVFVLPEDEA